MREFFLDMTPPTVTHQQKKVVVIDGRPRFYEPKRLKAARELLALKLRPYRPKEPYGFGIGLTVRWQFPRGKPCQWKTADDVFRWWMDDKNLDGQMDIFGGEVGET